MSNLSKERRLKLVEKEFLNKSGLKHVRKLFDYDPNRTATAVERKFICDKKHATPKIIHTELVSWAKTYLKLEIDQPTVSRLLKRKNEFKDVDPSTGKYRRTAAVKFPEIEDKVAKWSYKHQHNVNMSGDLIRRKAERVREMMRTLHLKILRPLRDGSTDLKVDMVLRIVDDMVKADRLTWSWWSLSARKSKRSWTPMN